MGTKWSTVSTSTYADNSPTDDGAATEANRIKYATIRSDLTDPLDTAIDQIVSNLDALFDEGTVAKSGPYTTVASDHKKLLEVTGAQTITLLAAATAGAGYRVAIKSDASSTVTVSRSGTDTIDGQTSVSLGADSFAIFIVNAAGNGYISDFNDVFTSLSVDTINEKTSASGVTVDGVLLQDGGVTATTASSFADSSGVALTVTGSGQELGLVSQVSSTATVGPFLDIDRNSASPAVDDQIGSVGFTGRNSAAGTVRYSDVRGWVVDPTSTAESGGLRFLTYDAGSYAARAVVKGSDFGIGTTNPTAKLHVTNTGSVNSLLVEDSTNPDSSPFVIDNDGRIIQGHTASLSGASPASFEQHSTSNYSTVGAPNVSVANWSTNGGFAGGLTFDRSLSGTVGTETTVVNGTDLGSIYWRGTDGSGFLQAAEILGEMDATPAGSGVDMPGRLSFRTTAVGSASPTERMRIDRDGDVGINTGDPDGKLHVHSATAGIVTASNDADELVLENSGSCGISLLAPDTQNTNIYFGSPSDAAGAYLRWNYNANLLKVATDKAGADMAFHTGASTEALRIDSAGLVGVGTSTPTEKLDINGDAIRVRTSQTPASAAATGDAGQICWDANYVYVCTATNTWKRSALATW